MDTQTVDERFEELQQKLTGIWKSISGFNDEPQTIVVLPSLSMDLPSGIPPSLLPAYEERFLFFLLLLRQPRARVVFLSSQPVDDDLVDYYLDLLPGVISPHARARLTMLSTTDPEVRPLTAKILESRELLEEIKRSIQDLSRAHIVPFNTTALERDLSLELGVPMYACDPRHLHHGTKQGSRRLFAQAGVPHPAGAEVGTLDEVVSATRALLSDDSTLSGVVVKLNQGVGGLSNSAVDLRGISPHGSEAEIADRVKAMTFDIPEITFDGFIEEMEVERGVVEARITGRGFGSPSVQMRVTPLGELEVLSTHDQILQGGQFLGSRFPADRRYASLITTEAVKIGDLLAAEGVIGRFAVDFVVVEEAEGWNAYAIEVNVRKGGTTHPFLTLQFLTDGAYDADEARFFTPEGEEKYFITSDHLHSDALVGLSPVGLFDIAVRRGLHFDQVAQTGSVFHMLSGLREHGRLGVTTVANSPEDAERTFESIEQILLDEAASVKEEYPP